MAITNLKLICITGPRTAASMLFSLEFNLNKQPHPALAGCGSLGLKKNDQNFVRFHMENKPSHVLPAVTQTQIIATDNPSY